MRWPWLGFGVKRAELGGLLHKTGRKGATNRSQSPLEVVARLLAATPSVASAHRLAFIGRAPFTVGLGLQPGIAKDCVHCAGVWHAKALGQLGRLQHDFQLWHVALRWGVGEQRREVDVMRLAHGLDAFNLRQVERDAENGCGAQGAVQGGGSGLLGVVSRSRR